MKAAKKGWLRETLRRAAWAPVTVFLLHVAISLFGGYGVIPALDIPMHLLGGAAIGYFLWSLYSVAAAAGVLGKPSKILGVILVFALICSSTVFWEFAEFLTDKYLGTRAQLDLDDTLFDMLLGILGGTAFLTTMIGRAQLTGLQQDSDNGVAT